MLPCTSLKNRIEIPDDDHLLVLTDNCCKDKCKVAQILGSNVIVKLDLFHAVQRILKAVAKHHPSFYHLKEDLKLVFRDFGDVGRVRKSKTPSPEVLISSFEEFTKSGKKLLMPRSPPLQRPRATFGIVQKEERTETEWLSFAS